MVLVFSPVRWWPASLVFCWWLICDLPKFQCFIFCTQYFVKVTVIYDLLFHHVFTVPVSMLYCLQWFITGCSILCSQYLTDSDLPVFTQSLFALLDSAAKMKLCSYIRSEDYSPLPSFIVDVFFLSTWFINMISVLLWNFDRKMLKMINISKKKKK